MDPNFPYNDPNFNGGYFYNPSNNFSQPQFHSIPQSHQPPPPPPPPLQPQSYYQPPYSQPAPQNYPQYYQNQVQHQPYQPQFQQTQQPYYQQPVPYQTRPPPPPLPDHTIEVSIPRRVPQPSPAQLWEAQENSRIFHQPPSQPQVQSSSPSYQQAPKQQQQQRKYEQQHTPQPQQRNIERPPQPQVVIDIPKPPKVLDQSLKNNEARRTSAQNLTRQKTPKQESSHVLQALEANSKLKQPVSKGPDRPNTPMENDGPEPDYPSLLCLLADDYIEEARKQSTLTEDYYNLVSKALGCFEAVLANFKLPPLREAQISLRYARVLYDETENHDEAETALTKSIELCERHKFIDLKYEMQLLLSKILYESKPKAALRDIQRMIEDIEAYRHTVWLYIFRFQHAMFSLASSAPGEVHSAVVQLEKITVLAKQNSDAAVLAFAATLEALLHLSSSSQEAVIAAQTALAKARAMQLNPDVESNPQMTILMEFIDLACSVRESNIVQTETKRKIMHDVLFQAVNHANWRDDGSIYIPVSKRTIAGIQLQANKHIIEKNGKFCLVFSWLDKEAVEILGYLFSADSSAYKNGSDGGKAEKFANEGLSLLHAWGKPGFTTGHRQAEKVSAFQKLLEAEFQLRLSFMRCSKGLWIPGNESLAEVNAISEEIGDSFPINLKYALLYLRGVILQGTGNITAALQVYQSPLFDFGSAERPSSSSHLSKATSQIASSHYADSDITRNFSILAAMNSVFIIQSSTHPQHNHLSSLIKSLDPAVQNCGNKYLQAHFSLLVSVLSGTTLTVKQYLKSAMEASKAIGSAQTTALALIYMQERLFKGVVEEQALKCAKAASHQTRRWGDQMWMYVTAGLEAQALEINGLGQEARKREADAENLWEALPEGVKSAGTGMALTA